MTQGHSTKILRLRLLNVQLFCDSALRWIFDASALSFVLSKFVICRGNKRSSLNLQHTLSDFPRKLHAWQTELPELRTIFPAMLAEK